MNSIPEAVLSSQQLTVDTGDSDEWILATHGRTFHFAARFLPPKIRHDIVTLYAFFRTLDVLVDVPTEERGIEDIHIELKGWRN